MAEQLLARRYRRWFAFECDAHERVWEALDSVPPEARTGEQYQDALDLFAHILTARQLWLQRFGVRVEGPAALFPRNTTRRSLRTLLDATQHEWSDYLERLEDDELARAFQYTALDGGRFESTVEDALAQMFGHSAYHRGQIASLLRRCGGMPAGTDFIHWSRKSLDRR